MLALDGLNRPDEMVGVGLEEPAPVEEEELAAAVEVPQAAGSEESSCAAPPCVDFEDLPRPQTVAGEGASAQPVYHPETVCGRGRHVVCSGVRALGILKNVCSMAIVCKSLA